MVYIQDGCAAFLTPRCCSLQPNLILFGVDCTIIGDIFMNCEMDGCEVGIGVSAFRVGYLVQDYSLD